MAKIIRTFTIDPSIDELIRLNGLNASDLVNSYFKAYFDTENPEIKDKNSKTLDIEAERKHKLATAAVIEAKQAASLATEAREREQQKKLEIEEQHKIAEVTEVTCDNCGLIKRRDQLIDYEGKRYDLNCLQLVKQKENEEYNRTH